MSIVANGSDRIEMSQKDRDVLKVLAALQADYDFQLKKHTEFADLVPNQRRHDFWECRGE